ncbi:Oxalate decarboxylase OxdC [Fulvia fulva]|nr:Oxalate decarboxylase OxdC [Fulvia fulva]
MKLSGALAVSGLVTSAWAAPYRKETEYLGKRQAIASRGSEIDNSAIPFQPVGPVGSSGNVYGGPGLLGNAGDGKAPQDVGPGVPAKTASTQQDAGQYTLSPGQEEDADLGLYLDLSENLNPQAIRGKNGGIVSGPRNEEYQRLNPDMLARPGTDMGSVANAKWPMGLSSARSGTGGGNPGWARQQNTNELPIATAMAGVNMHLGPNAYRELHWHSANDTRISTVNQNGETFLDDLQAGDLWFFPAGVPHSIQASEEGVEFLLIFNQGDFSEDATDLVSEFFARNPKEVLAKNFQVDVSVLKDIPTEQRYIFNGTPYKGTTEEARKEVDGPAGALPANESYSYHLSAQAPYTVPGGSVKIVDPTTFPIANNFSAALFTVEPGAMREIHWHLTSNEWNFLIQGQGRVTVFQGPQASRTFDFTAGDVGYIPVADSHYIENTGNETLVYLEVLQAPRYIDISAAQWLGLTPGQVVKDTLNVPQSFIDTLPKTKRYIVPGNPDLLTTNFTVADYPNAKFNATGTQAKSTGAERSS